MILARGSLLLAIYGISCCYSLRLHQLATDFQGANARINPESEEEEEDDTDLEIQKFEQKVNHFDKADTRKWNQHYYMQDKYYKTNGPAYLWIEGTDFLLPNRLKSGYWVSHAEKKNAMLFSISHRFHDIGQPLEIQINSLQIGDLTTDNLDYLSVSQALSDYVEFIKGMNKLHNLPESTKWIIFGYSYGGNLAAWMRAKYPALVHGAVASSAPLLAKMDIPEYLDNVAGSIELSNKTCKTDITLANQKLDELAQTEKGRKDIENTFKLCEPLDGNKFSLSVLMDDMTSFIAHEIQFDLENEKLRKICHTMLKDANTKTPIQRYAALMDEYLRKYQRECLSSNFDKEIDSLQGVDLFSALSSGRAWLYQMCTEFGWFQITGKKSKAFSKNLNSEYYIELCSKTFKPSFNKKFISQGVAKTNKLYGGLKLNTPRTLFVHGSSDPWRSLGIISTKKNKNVEVVIIKGGTHATDATYHHVNSKNKDREAAIKKIMATLDSWL